MTMRTTNYYLTLHPIYHVSYFGFNYNNVVGFITLIIFVVQFLTGLLLSSYYCDYYVISFDPIVYIIDDVNVGWFIRFLHVIGVSLFILSILIHLIRGIWIKFKIIYLDSTINIIWISGLLLSSLPSIEGFLGYILIWGQMSYWGITVILNVMSIIPLFGVLIIELLWCSSIAIVYRVFISHFLIGVIIGSLILFHIFILHSFTNSNPIISSNSPIIIPSYPSIYKDIFIILSFLLYIFSFILYWEPEILGNKDNLILANPLLTPKNILPEWYYLCFYRRSRCFPNKLFGVIIVILLLFLLLL